MANLSNINNKFIVTDGGHVSIGATTTTYPLTVESGGVGTVLRAGTSFVSIDSVGSAASPSLIFNGDSNTGIWRPASDTLGFSTAGVERFKIGTSNALLIGTSYQLKFTTDDGSTQLGKLFEDVGFTVEGKINNNLNLRSLANTTQEGIKFQNKTGGVLSTHMFIEKAGNITIGNGDTGLTFGKLVLRGDPYVITDSGQARSFIDCSSNINPGAGLYTGAISFGGASTGRAAISGVQSPSGSDGDRQGLAFFTHGSGTGSADAAEAMRIQSDGNVGIGTDSPGSKLHVVDGNNYAKLGDLHGNSTMSLRMADNSGFPVEVQAYGTELRFNTATTTGATPSVKMNILPNGNVGIGTSSPDKRLTVGGVNPTEGINLKTKSGSNVWTLWSVEQYFSQEGYMRLFYDNVSKIQFRADGDSFINGGNVGIGTTSPDNKLQVVAGNGNVQAWFGESSYTRSALRVGGDNSPGGRLFFEYNGDDSYIDSYGGHGSTQRYRDLTIAARNIILTTGNTSGSEKMRITSGGSLLVGGQTSTVYTEKFSIENTTASQGMVINQTDNANANDKIIFQNTNGVVGYIRTTGSATSYVTSSDYRLKEDLQDFNGLDKVSKIPVYNFKWKTDESRSYGVMAHELQEVLPDAVSGDKDAEEMQGVDYSKIVPLLVKSIQELKAEIDELKK